MGTGTGDGSGPGFLGTDDYESLISTTDAELLKRAWRNEKAAPEILHFEAALVQRSWEQIQLMEETVRNSQKMVWSHSVYEYRSIRWTWIGLFLLRSYLRTRLQKIEKYVFHIQKTSEHWNRLSKQRTKVCQKWGGEASGSGSICLA